jgi:type VI secretion system protein ImpE
MLAEDLIRQGRIPEALKALEDAVRKSPADSKLRIFLFQILCVTGAWERALTQLGVVNEMDPKALLMVKTCQAAIQCEALRSGVFKGERSPLVLGEPSDWVAKMIQASTMQAQGNVQAAATLREQAFEAAPATTGTLEVGADAENIESIPFEWIADADERLGPMFEAIVDGKYYWIPYERVSLIRIEKPVDLRDAVWAPCQFVWATGGQGVGFIPVRYPTTETVGNDAQRLARATDFVDGPSGTTIPLGHRLIATDAGEHNLLTIRAIKLNAHLNFQSSEPA